jgi:hypothetical protein
LKQVTEYIALIMVFVNKYKHVSHLVALDHAPLLNASRLVTTIVRLDDILTIIERIDKDTVPTFTDDTDDSHSRLKHTETPHYHNQAPLLIDCVRSLSLYHPSRLSQTDSNKASQRRQPRPLHDSQDKRNSRPRHPLSAFVIASLPSHFICRAPVLGLRTRSSNRVVFVLPLSAKRGARFAPLGSAFSTASTYQPLHIAV